MTNTWKIFAFGTAAIAILAAAIKNSAPVEGNHRRTPNRNVKGLSLTRTK